MCNMVAIAMYDLSLVGVVGLLYMAQQDSLYIPYQTDSSFNLEVNLALITKHLIAKHFNSQVL